MTQTEFEEVVDSLFELGLVEVSERDGELGLTLTDAGREAIQQLQPERIQ